MKKILFIINFLILVLVSSAYGQQFLWSTAKMENVRHVNMKNVPKEVLVFYDQYDLYYDFTGFSKDRFIEMFNYGFEDLEELLNKVEEPTVFAARSNMGDGSVVLVMLIGKNDINTIIFANSLQRGLGMGSKHTFRYERDKFSQWFRTLFPR